MTSRKEIKRAIDDLSVGTDDLPTGDEYDQLPPVATDLDYVQIREGPEALFRGPDGDLYRAFGSVELTVEDREALAEAFDVTPDT